MGEPMGAAGAIVEEDVRQLGLLATARGEPQSGRVRYAAAMYFYQRGMLSEASLEVYRTCSVFDHEDPRPVLARCGLSSEVASIEIRVGATAAGARIRRRSS